MKHPPDPRTEPPAPASTGPDPGPSPERLARRLDLLESLLREHEAALHARRAALQEPLPAAGLACTVDTEPVPGSRTPARRVRLGRIDRTV